ncbi:glutaredoxin domain-containing protein [Streptomyces sp. NPDC059443]|uniref:glutaredoxin domain-containing protein n=1 Tax=unclassified Streptomyces TaxID=2593676 RepID=UPI00367CE550
MGGLRGGSVTAGATVYWRPGCPDWRRLRFKLWLARVPYTLVDIGEDPDAAAFVRSCAYGIEMVPMVAFGDRPGIPSPSLRELREAAA